MGGPRVFQGPFPEDNIIVEGPTVFIRHASNLYLDCTVVCTNPNPPDLTIVSSSKSAKKGGKSRFPPETAEDLSNSLKNDILDVYDPFGSKFPF